MVEIREYVAEDGNNRYKNWFNNLDYQAARKVHIAVTRLKFGNFSNVQGVGRGLYEYKIDYGPGYRIYFGKDGEQIIILVGGGTKKRRLMTFIMPHVDGRSINSGKSRRINNGTHTRF